MKDLILEFADLCKTTVGISAELVFLKTGEYKIKFNKGNHVKAELKPPFREPEEALRDGIQSLNARRKPLPPNAHGAPAGATHTVANKGYY